MTPAYMDFADINDHLVDYFYTIMPRKFATIW